MAKSKSPTKSKPIGSSFYTLEHLQLIREKPHILGWMLGYKDLSDIHSEWIKYIWTSGRGVALNAHRGSYKSTAIVIVGSVWYLLFNPEARIFIVQKTFSDAAEAVATIAKNIDQPEIRELFYFAQGEYPEFRSRREGSVEFSFKKHKTKDPSLKAFGLTSQFTGHHADFILCDDISTVKDRLSKAEREFTKSMWREISTNVIDRGKPCCYIGTPWHKDGVESIIPSPLKFSINECNIMTAEQVEEARRRTTPALFAANYLLEFAADDDALFKNPVYGEWESENIERVYAQVDAAFGGEDFIALTLMARRKRDQKIQAIGFIWSGTIADHIQDVVDKMKLYNCKKIYVELNPDKGYTSQMLKAKGVSVVEYQENTNKQHKIATHLFEVWPEIIWDEGSDELYMEQIVDWTPISKEHDDAPDSASSLCRAKYSKKAASQARWQW